MSFDTLLFIFQFIHVQVCNHVLLATGASGSNLCAPADLAAAAAENLAAAADTTVASFALRRAAEAIRLAFDDEGVPFVGTEPQTTATDGVLVANAATTAADKKKKPEDDLADMMKNLHVGLSSSASGLFTCECDDQYAFAKGFKAVQVGFGLAVKLQ